jgi:outer membrane protein OmpA-like peptidoglycan-associated protein
MLLALPVLCVTTDLRAQDDDKPHDIEGCKDSSLITRLPGTIISDCPHKDFDQFAAPIGMKDGEPVTKTLEGDVQKWDYTTLPGTSQLKVFRNIESALKTAGFTIVWESSPGLITARKGNTWYSVDTNNAESNNGYYEQTIVTVQAMQQEVTADASSLANALDTSGHIAVYGIHFDTGKATIQPDSETTLDEIVKLLGTHPELHLRVEGHTDNQGNAGLNQTLSEKRAQAVVAWLVAHGTTASRLSAKGFGASQPVADNSTDEGRAKNRRVELVKP